MCTGVIGDQQLTTDTSEPVSIATETVSTDIKTY